MDEEANKDGTVEIVRCQIARGKSRRAKKMAGKRRNARLDRFLANVAREIERRTYVATNSETSTTAVQ